MAPIPKRPEDRHRAPKRAELTPAPPRPSDYIIPAPPAGLLKATVDRWEAYWRSAASSAVDLAADGAMLERWIRSLDEWHRAYREFRRNRTTKGSTGQLVLNPLAKWIRQLEGEISACEQQMGLTPLSRVKLGLAAGQARLTADMLNAALSEGDDDDDDHDDRDALDAEYAEA